MLASKFPSNHHNLDGLDFSRYKKKYMTLLWLSIAPIKKSQCCFFQKSGRQLKKNPNPPPTKKHVFGYSSIHPWNLLVKVAECTRSPAHLFCAPRPGSKFLGSMVAGVPGNHGCGWDLPCDLPDESSASKFLSWASSSGLSRSWNHNRANRSCTRWNHNHAEKVTPGAPVPRCHGAKQWEGTQLTTPKKTGFRRNGASRLGTKLQKSHIKTWSPRSWCKEIPKLQPSQRGDEWRRSLANAKARAHTRSHCEGADFRSRRRHRCFRFFSSSILRIIGRRSQLDSMRSQFLWDMLDIANAPRQVARTKEDMENIIVELHLGAWHTELQRECTQGSLLPLGQSAQDFNKLQWYLPGNRMVNGAKLLFHPNIKLKAVHGTAWNTSAGLRVFAAAWGVEIWATKKVK